MSANQRPAFATPEEMQAQAKPRRKSGPSPTMRALQEFRGLGYTCQVVERWNQYARVRQDLFGCIDVVCIHPTAGILAVQACAAASHAARRKKAMDEPRLRTWLAAGGKFEVVSFDKQGPRGQRKLWTIRREPVTLGDFA